jgi:enoyl-CoA hydratase/carnithine racemase
MLNVEFRDPVLTLTLNRPEVRNAFNDELIAALSQQFEQLQDGTRAVVIRAEGPAFCAGGDLDWMRRAASYTEDENYQDALKLARLFGLIQSCPAVVIARVQGAAFGGGCGLVAAADVAVASDSALFAFSEVRLGLIPATIAPFVISKIGAGHARALFTTGEAFKAERALRIGLVHEVSDETGLDDAVNAKLKAILAAGPKAVVGARRLVLDDVDSPEETARRLADARADDEGKEGVAAFLEKRPAAWVRPQP